MAKKWKQLVAVTALTAVAMVSIMPYVNAESLDLSQFDQTGDGNCYLEDFQIMLEKIIDNEEGIDEKIDINKDGVAAVDDLDALRMYGKICGGEEPGEIRGSWISDAELQVKRTEQKITVDVIGHGGNMGYFDYALLYDQEKLRLESVEWDLDFLVHFSEYNPSSYSFFTKRVEEGKIVLAGCYYPGGSYEIGKIAKLTFSYIGEEKETGELHLVYEQSKYKNNPELLKEKVHKCILGNPGGSDAIDMWDAQLMLQYALKIKDWKDFHHIKYLDLNGDEDITLEDANIALKQALKILPQKELVVDYFASDNEYRLFR